MKTKALCLLALAIVISPYLITAQETKVAMTPAMGWNSWNKFGCNVSEDMIREMADAMVKSGMRDAGYRYIVIDDCWQVSRDSSGNIVPDPKRFSSGIKALADYVHGKGLKFGIYSDAGTKTCAGRPGARGYEFQDARQYAAWGVDFLKFDWCSTTTQDGPSSYALMRQALDTSGRSILFSMCEWGTNKPWLWAKDIGNSWRTTGDISDVWASTKKDQLGVVDILDMQVGLESFAGPGHWNDPDMLEVGNGGMTVPEYRAHFSLWSLLASPLMAGNDLRDMKPEIQQILTNKEVIAVNQDPLGKQGRRVHKDGDLEVWAKQMQDGGRAVILLNRGTDEKEIGVSWQEIGYPSHLSAAVRDLWQGKDLGSFKEKFAASVPSHTVVMVRVNP
jgi:alpha-galactosidase